MASNYNIPFNLPVLFGDLVKQVGLIAMPKINAWFIANGYPQSNMSLGYHFGTWLDIIGRITEDASNPNKKDIRFPMVALIQDYKIEYYPNINPSTKLRLIIVNQTTIERYNEDRYAINFVPILHPICSELINQIEVSNLFYGYKGSLKYTLIEHPHWGQEAYNGHEKYELNEFIDGIELANLELQLNYQNCLLKQLQTNETNFF